MCVFERCLERCRKQAGVLVLPDGADRRVLAAAGKLRKEGLCEPVLVGNPSVLRAETAKAGLRQTSFVCIDPEEPKRLEENTQTYMALAAAKNRPISEESARGYAAGPLVAGAFMLRRKEADVGLAGNLSSTADVLRAGLRVIGTAPGGKTVFSVFFMIAPGGEQLLVFADCAVIPSPTAQQLADVATGAARCLHELMGQVPRVAFLSHSTKGSAEHPDVALIREALELALKQSPGLAADGELQMDAALSPEVAAQKAPGSPVAGRANVLVFPSIQAGNISYKTAQRLCGWTALGPFLLGFSGAWHDLSRGCSVDDIYKIAVIGMGMTREQAAE